MANPTTAVLELEEEIVRYFTYRPEDSKEYVAGLDADDFEFPHTQRIFAEIQARMLGGIIYNRTIIIQEVSGDQTAVDALDFPPRVTELEIKAYCEKLKDVSAKRRIVDYIDQAKVDVTTKKVTARDFASASIDFFRDLIDTTTILDSQAVDISAHIGAHRKDLEDVRSGKILGITTGMPLMDSFLAGGLKGGDLILVGARPSIGKTSFSLSVSLNAALAGAKVLFISVEMRAKDVIDRLVSFVSKKPLTEIIRGFHREEVEEAYQKLAAIKFKIVEAPRFTSRDVISVATREKYVNGLDLVVVDYLQYLSDTAGKQSDSVRVGRISRNLKSLAGSLNVPLIAPSQLNRQAEHRLGASKGVPSLEDLRDSGSLEQDADIVMLLHRKEDDPSQAIVRVAKNRKGETGAIPMEFNQQTTMFSERHIPGL